MTLTETLGRLRFTMFTGLHKTMATETHKRQKTQIFHDNWETDFCFTNVKDKCDRLICEVSVAMNAAWAAISLQAGNVQLCVNTIARRVSALSLDAPRPLEIDINRCKWFSIQWDEC